VPPLQEDLLRLTRRHFLGRSGLAFGAAALGTLLAESLPPAAQAAAAPPDPLAPKKPHFAARVKRVIYLHMIGAPSQLDLFDFKPELVKWDGKPCPEEFIKGKRFAFLRGHPNLAASRYRFAQHGRSGATVSELLPHLATVADELCFIHSVQTDEFNHAPAQLFLHTGFGRPGRPAFGSWLGYGLGSEGRDLPAYVVLQSGPMGGAGTALWSSGFLPGAFQGVPFRGEGESVPFLTNPKDTSRDDRRRVLDAVRGLNESRLADVGDPEIATRVAHYELAFRMQASVPDLMDLSHESPQTLALYGARPGKASFANNCLLARRLVERGVRVVELYDADWDHHMNLHTALPTKCKQVDQALAALVSDLKRRGLLNDTLVIWGSEFGRTPMQQGTRGAPNVGRDHHKEAFTVWMAGGGVKPGLAFGATDELGYHVTANPVHVHDLNATVLHLLGLDHEKLTFRYQGRDFRLTDVHGRVVKEILA
jgi:uncharacterized protein (DUF1501 family)